MGKDVCREGLKEGPGKLIDQENRGEGYRCGVGSEASAQVLRLIRACVKHVPQLL